MGPWTSSGFKISATTATTSPSVSGRSEGSRRRAAICIELAGWIIGYLEAVGQVRGDPKESPLFRRADYHTPTWLGDEGVGPWTIRNILMRRLKDAGLPTIFTPHSFRVMVVTALIDQGVPIEDVQYLAGHSHPSTTQVYDRRARRVTRTIVEKIPV